MTDTPATPTASKMILLVEDNADDEALTVRALSRNGIDNVQIVRDGIEALDYLFCRGAFSGRDINARPAVTLLDLKLPFVDGLEVLRQVRGNPQTRFLPMVILTSSSEEQDLVQGYGLGANSYIRKPVDFTQFLEAVRQVGVYWLSLNENPPPQS